MNKCLTAVAFILFFFLNTGYASAKIYINEFYSYTIGSDWVEIYNDSESDIVLDSYCIRDSSKTNKLQLSGTIQAKKFLIFDWGDKLNRTEDVIKIFNNCGENQDPEDQIEYGKNENPVSAPLENQTAGRKTDGAAEWVIFSQATAGSPNVAPIIPTSTPEPTNTPVPSRTPTPTKIPTPTKTPSPVKSSVNAKTPTPLLNPKQNEVETSEKTKMNPASIPLNTPANLQKKKIGTNASELNLPSPILGANTKKIAKITQMPKPNSPTPSMLFLASNSQLPAPILTIAGSLLIISCGIILASKIKKFKHQN